MKLKEAKQVVATYEAEWSAAYHRRQECVKLNRCTSYTDAARKHPGPELSVRLRQAEAIVWFHKRLHMRSTHRFLRPLRTFRLYRDHRKHLREIAIDNAFCPLTLIDNVGGAASLKEARQYFLKNKVESCF